MQAGLAQLKVYTMTLRAFFIQCTSLCISVAFFNMSWLFPHLYS